MAVVISELIIRARAGSEEPRESGQADTPQQEDRAELVQEVAAEVMRLLRREREA